jgi:hypothetical protein
MLFCVDAVPRTAGLRNRKRRGVNVQLLLSFLSTPTPAGAAPVWAALDEEQRAEVLTTLVRLIAKMADARSKGGAATETESNDE